jgi:hypothetical protein
MSDECVHTSHFLGRSGDTILETPGGRELLNGIVMAMCDGIPMHPLTNHEEYTRSYLI